MLLNQTVAFQRVLKAIRLLTLPRDFSYQPAFPVDTNSNKKCNRVFKAKGSS